MIKSVKCGWLLALTLFHPDVSAQFKNVKIDEVSFHSQLTQPTVDILTRDGQQLAATGFDDMFYSSKDKGATWEKSKLESSVSSQEHVLVSDPKGTLYLIQTIVKGKDGMRQVVCMISKDGGKVWEAPVEVGKNDTKDQCYPAATLDTKGNLIVTWSQLDKYGDADSTCQSLIYLSSSSTGKKWSKPIQLAQTPGDCLNDKQTAVGSGAAVGPDGKMFVSWYGQEKMHMDRSFGNGMWLENDILIANQPLGWKTKVPGHVLVTGLPRMMIDQSKG
ncbi:MAG TPA: hypothetical protein VK666_22875, partial [Chryseolinea sp.]|nr:hypothetical protein [Chryseolinea sp.]